MLGNRIRIHAGSITDLNAVSGTVFKIYIVIPRTCLDQF